jgi:hypothetical protein
MLKPLARLITLAGLKKQARKAEQFLNWQSIRSMALIIGAGEKVNKSRVDSFIDKTGKHVEVYYIELASKKPSFADWRCFTRDHRNILRLPVDRVQNELRGKSYDFVLNACDGSYLFPATIAALLSAPFKCAVSDLLGYANLEVKRPATQELDDYLAEVQKYLMMIRT